MSAVPKSRTGTQTPAAGDGSLRDHERRFHPSRGSHRQTNAQWTMPTDFEL